MKKHINHNAKLFTHKVFPNELDKHPDFHAKQANFKDKKQGD